MIKKISSILFLTLIIACNTANNDAITNITLEQQIEMSEEANVVVLDVRTPGEVAEGYIKGTDEFIDFQGKGFNEKVSALDKSKTYIVYCRSGGRSTKALNAMVGLGFKDLYELTGGISGVSKPEYIVK